MDRGHAASASNSGAQSETDPSESHFTTTPLTIKERKTRSNKLAKNGTWYVSNQFGRVCVCWFRPDKRVVTISQNLSTLLNSIFDWWSYVYQHCTRLVIVVVDLYQ